MDRDEFLARYFPWEAERVSAGVPSEAFDPNPERCPSVWSHVHGRSRCDLRVKHKAEEHHGRCVACWHDGEDDALSWKEEA